MQLTKAVEQAACIIIFLATQERNEPIAADKISKILEVSPSYFKKISRKLVVKKIITSVPGNNGGITLAKDLKEISILDVIEAVEGPISIYKDTGLINFIFKDGKYAEKGSEVIRDAFKQADELLVQYFSKITVADLLKEGFGTQSLPTLNWNKQTLSEFLQQERGE